VIDLYRFWPLGISLDDTSTTPDCRRCYIVISHQGLQFFARFPRTRIVLDQSESLFREILTMHAY
jgi:hypothetical protein